MDALQIIYLLVVSLFIIKTLRNTITKKDYEFPDHSTPTQVPQTELSIEDLIKKYQLPEDKIPTPFLPKLDKTTENISLENDTIESESLEDVTSLSSLFKEEKIFTYDDEATFELSKIKNSSFIQSSDDAHSKSTLSTPNDYIKTEVSYTQKNKKTKLMQAFIHHEIFSKKYD